ncbi:MAG: hypothetical protein ACREVO_12355 [Steroidobacteraceae bacterium]
MDTQASGSVKVSPVRLTGTLRNKETLDPLQDLLVDVYYVDPAQSKGQPGRRLLGSATSDVNGSFLVSWQQDATVVQLLCLLSACSDASYIATVSVQADQDPLLTTSPASLHGAVTSLDLAIPIPAQAITTAQWSDLGARAAASGVTTVSGIAAQLTLTPTGQSIFSDWTLVQRQNAAAQLGIAFLDPQGVLSALRPLPGWQALEAPGGLDAYRQSLGDKSSQADVVSSLAELAQKLTAFSSLSSVDWQIDPTKFAQGVSAPITAVQHNYFGVLPVPILRETPSELGYRNYLLAQWTSMITLVEYIEPYKLTVAQADQQLRNRFHQDFATTDRTMKAANEVLIPILTEILTSAPGTTFGFGIAAGSIPARGAMTARAFLDALTSLSSLSSQELSLRYRADFTRPDTVQSSGVWENIFTLQGFFRDNFQSVVDPAHADPDILKQPIVPSMMQGRAPYFLEYEEWLQLQQPIPFENYVQVRLVFQMNTNADARSTLSSVSAASGPNQAACGFFTTALTLNDALQAAYQNVDRGEYATAIAALNGASTALFSLLSNPIVATVDIAGSFAARRGNKIASMSDLNDLLTTWQVGSFDPTDSGALEDFLGFYTPKLVSALVYASVFTLPCVIAQASLALGGYVEAIRPLGRAAFLLVGKAASEDKAAWRQHYTGSDFSLYSAGDLPYTVQTGSLPGYPSLGDDDSKDFGDESGPTASMDSLAASLVPNGLHTVERAFYRLQLGTAMLGWADMLFRSDDSASVARARELYKGVYFLHGSVPPINPSWNPGAPSPGIFFAAATNPALISQLTRAELGFTEIQSGLNYFGFADDMVPVLRYETLKSAADTFAGNAKSIEEDFLNAMTQLETATIENMKNTAMLQRANMQASIAGQQAQIAQDQLQQAQIVVTQVNQQIAASQSQIADHDSFFGQVGDYFSGMSGIVKDLPSSFTSSVGGAAESEAGISSTDASGLLGLGAGASVLAGFGAFYVASYMTLSSMNSAQNQRVSQLANLQTQNLVAAQAQVDIAQRSASIANYQQQIAELDAQLASQLLSFGQTQFLSAEFWAYYGMLLRRILGQYLDLATRMGWLAQRALSYEQNADVSLVGMDYFPAQELGVGGAEQLQLDLATLEAQHLNGMKEMIPVKYTVSLARDFPLQFGQLRNTGRCTFQTTEQPMNWAYPGTFSYRVIACTPTLVRTRASSAIRGMLTNSGVSEISAVDGSLSLSLRPIDALAISDFNLGTTDRQIFGLPGGSLMQFEGSGINTIWNLEFPPAGNPSGLTDLADVLISFDLRAQFAPSLYQTQSAGMPTGIAQSIVVSARNQGLSGLADLAGKPSKASISFDVTAIGLPPHEKGRTINNLAVLLIGLKNPSSVKATVIAATSSQSAAVTLTNGVAFSNAPPITDSGSSVALSPLNVFASVSADQTISVEIDKTVNSGVDFGTIRDALLCIDYTAALS